MTPNNDIKNEQVHALGFRRAKVDAYWLSLDLHALVLAAIPLPKRGSSRRSEVERSSVKTFTIISDAANATEQHARDSLSLAFRTTDHTLTLMEGLVAEGRVKDEAYAAVHGCALKLLDRLRELMEMQVSEWPLFDCPPRAGEAVERGELRDDGAVLTPGASSLLRRLKMARALGQSLVAKLEEREVLEPNIGPRGNGSGGHALQEAAPA